MAVTITAPLAQGDSTALTIAKFSAVIDAWCGAGQSATCATFGDAYAKLAPVASAFGLSYVFSGNKPGADELAALNQLNDIQGVLSGIGLAWWTADRADLITLSGSLVSSFKDVYNGYDAAQAVNGSRPVYDPTGFNGAPCMIVDGSDDELVFAGAPFPIGSAPSKLRAVKEEGATAADPVNRGWFGYGSTINDSRQMRRAVSGGIVRARGQVGSGAGNVVLDDVAVDFTGRHMHKLSVTATDFTQQVDMAAPTSQAITPATASVRTKLFAITSSSPGTNYGLGKGRDFIITANETVAQDAYIDNVFNSRRRA